jgi:hypothetical protein
MNKQQRAQYYLQLLNEARNPEIAKSQILTDLNSLVWTNTKIPLTEAEKIEILDDLDKLYSYERIIRKSVPGIENYDSINEADNSGILDVISALKRGVKR